MRFTSQTYSGELESTKHHVESLQQALTNRDGVSMMQYVRVYAFSLALVLDRLAFLEAYYHYKENHPYTPKMWRDSTPVNHKKGE